MPIPVVVKVYNDRSFEFVTKSPPAAGLLKQAAGIAKGSGVPNKEKVGKATFAQWRRFARRKWPTSMPATWSTPGTCSKGWCGAWGWKWSVRKRDWGRVSQRAIEIYRAR